MDVFWLLFYTMANLDYKYRVITNDHAMVMSQLIVYSTIPHIVMFLLYLTLHFNDLAFASLPWTMRMLRLTVRHDRTLYIRLELIHCPIKRVNISLQDH